MARSSNSRADYTRSSRYSVGVQVYAHKGKLIPSTVGSPAFDNYTRALDRAEYQMGMIPAGYEARPDLVSNLFFGGTDAWWKVMCMNNFTDPFEHVIPGYQILLPATY